MDIEGIKKTVGILKKDIHVCKIDVFFKDFGFHDAIILLSELSEYLKCNPNPEIVTHNDSITRIHVSSKTHESFSIWKYLEIYDNIIVEYDSSAG